MFLLRDLLLKHFQSYWPYCLHQRRFALFVPWKWLVQGINLFFPWFSFMLSVLLCRCFENKTKHLFIYLLVNIWVAEYYFFFFLNDNQVLCCLCSLHGGVGLLFMKLYYIDLRVKFPVSIHLISCLNEEMTYYDFENFLAFVFKMHFIVAQRVVS